MKTISKISHLALSLLLTSCSGEGDPIKPYEARGLTPLSVDLSIDKSLLERTVEVGDFYYSPDSCSVKEGLVNSSGIRRLLSFSTAIINMGENDLQIGNQENPVPPLSKDNFEFDECHGHFHFLNFAEYKLKSLSSTNLESVYLQNQNAKGHKQGFYLVNIAQYFFNPAQPLPNNYPFQAISSGWADIYGNGTPGQWIDVTGLPEGDYELEVSVNEQNIIEETHNYYPNVQKITVHLPDPKSPLPVSDYSDPILPINPVEFNQSLP